MRKIFTAFLISITGQLAAFAQDDVQTPSGRPLPKTVEQIRKENLETRMDNMRRLNNARPEISLPGAPGLTRKERRKFEEISEVSDEEKARHRDFLKESNTGIFRLLPDFGCENENIIRTGGECANFVPGLWAYSLRTENHTNEIFQDLSFKGDKLVSDGLLAQGIFVSLENASLETISLESVGLNSLRAFAPAEDRKAASAQYLNLSAGIRENGVVLKNKIEVAENGVYALRVIAYDYKDKWRSRLWNRNIEKASPKEREFMGIADDKRNDSIYVFKIVGRSEIDGGITILWKRLSKEKSPKLVYEEDERLKDFKTKD